MKIKIKFLLENFSIIAIVSTFGTYLGSYPVRMEHVILYSGFIFFLILFIFKTSHVIISKKTFYLLKILIIFFCYSLCLNFFLGNFLIDKYTLGQIDRFILPIITLLIMGWILSYKNINIDLIWKKILICLVFGCIVVSFIIFYQGFIGPPSWLNYFLPGDASFQSKGTVAERAFGSGRYTGIFSSPSEAGLYMSVGLLLSAYLVVNNYKKILGYYGLIFISLGGLMSVSKVMIVGIILTVLFLLWNLKKRNYLKICFIFIFFSLLVFILNTIYLDYFEPLKNMQKYYPWNWNEDTDVLKLLTAKRFSNNEEGTLIIKFRENPMIFGGGFRNYGTVDSAFLEVWLIGGVIGLLLLSLILIYPIYKGWRNKKFIDGKLMFFLGLLFTIASIGAPAITKNRVSIVYFIILSVLIFLIHKKKRLMTTFLTKKVRES